MKAVDGQVEHPTNQQQVLTEVLEDSKMLSDYWDALSHVKNEKQMLKIEETDEYIKLVAFIDEFLDIKNLENTRSYVSYLINDLKIFTLIPSSVRSKLAKKDKKLEDS